MPSILERSLRHLRSKLAGDPRMAVNGNGAVTVTETKFCEDPTGFIRDSLSRHQVIVTDEHGGVAFILGASQQQLFPEDNAEDPIEPTGGEVDPGLYESWLR